MKTNNKGFTLIELLAIIVILVVIALIGTPIVTNIINTTRISAAERTCDAVREATEMLYNTSVMLNPNFGGATIKFENNNATVTPIVENDKVATFDYKNTYPQSGTITIAQDGTITWGVLVVNTYQCSADAKGKYTCVKPGA